MKTTRTKTRVKTVVRKTVVTKTTTTVVTVAPRKPKAPKGLILYRGPSLIDGRPIVAVAVNVSGKSHNAKTGGGFIQVYILSDEGVKPTDAIKQGLDHSICGDCVHRSGSCYVNVGQGPNMVFDALQRGVYAPFHAAKHLHLFKGRLLRGGAYGDPAAVPYRVWHLLCGAADGHTGYTHQWRSCDPRIKQLFMASVETPAQRLEAKAAGWRTFRTRLESQQVEKGEFACPASAEAGKRLTCEECLACDGALPGGNHASPTIIVHGSPAAGDWKVKRFEAAMAGFGEVPKGKGRRVSLTVLVGPK